MTASPYAPGRRNLSSRPGSPPSGTDSFNTLTAGTTHYPGFHATDNAGNAGAAGGVVPFADTLGGPKILVQSESIPVVPGTGVST